MGLPWATVFDECVDSQSWFHLFSLSHTIEMLKLWFRRPDSILKHFGLIACWSYDSGVQTPYPKILDSLPKFLGGCGLKIEDWRCPRTSCPNLQSKCPSGSKGQDECGCSDRWYVHVLVFCIYVHVCVCAYESTP